MRHHKRQHAAVWNCCTVYLFVLRTVVLVVHQRSHILLAHQQLKLFAVQNSRTPILGINERLNPPLCNFQIGCLYGSWSRHLFLTALWSHHRCTEIGKWHNDILSGVKWIMTRGKISNCEKNTQPSGGQSGCSNRSMRCCVTISQWFSSRRVRRIGCIGDFVCLLLKLTKVSRPTGLDYALI